LLALADRDVVRSFLDRIDVQLIPNGIWDHAENLLLKILAERSFRGWDDVYQRAVELLMRVSQGRAKKQDELRELASETVDPVAVFPRVLQKYGRQEVEHLADEIASRGTVFDFGATR
jgi:hypothetical protein